MAGNPDVSGGMRLLLLLSDDHFLSEVLGTYLRRDGIEVVPIESIVDALPHVEEGAGAILIDLSKRGIGGEDIISMSQRTVRANVPLLLISAQSRREIADFAAVVRASDVVSKNERMTAIAARLRMWVNGPAESGFAIPELAVGSA